MEYFRNYLFFRFYKSKPLTQHKILQLEFHLHSYRNMHNRARGQLYVLMCSSLFKSMYIRSMTKMIEYKITKKLWLRRLYLHKYKTYWFWKNKTTEFLNTAVTYQAADVHNFGVAVLKPFTSLKFKYFVSSGIFFAKKKNYRSIYLF